MSQSQMLQLVHFNLVRFYTYQMFDYPHFNCLSVSDSPLSFLCVVLYIFFQSTIHLWVRVCASMVRLACRFCFVAAKIHHRQFMSISSYLVITWQKRDVTKSRVLLCNIQETENANEYHYVCEAIKYDEELRHWQNV